MLKRVTDAINTVFPKARAGLQFAPTITERFHAVDHHIILGNYQKALKELNVMLGMPLIENDCLARALVHFRKGVCYRATMAMLSAENSFIRALNNDEKMGDAHIELGLIYLERFHFEKANEHFEKAGKLLADPVRAFIGQGYVHVASKNYDTALKIFRMVRVKDPSKHKIMDVAESELYESRGLDHLTQRESMKAVEDFLKAKKLDDTRAEELDGLICQSYFFRGVDMFVNGGNRQGAMAVFASMLTLIPDMKGNLVTLLRETAQFDETLSDDIRVHLNQMAEEIESGQNDA